MDYLISVFLEFSKEKLQDKFYLKVCAMVIKLIILFLKTWVFFAKILKKSEISKNHVIQIKEDFLKNSLRKSLELLRKTLENGNGNIIPEEFINNILDFMIFAVSNDPESIEYFFQMEKIEEFLFNSIAIFSIFPI